MKIQLTNKIKLMVVLLIATLPCSIKAQSLSTNEKEYALKLLESTEKNFINSIKGLTPEQWNWKADTSRWSIAECAEHITLSEGMLFGLVKDKIMTSPADPSKKSEVKVTTDDLVKKVEDRSFKAKAPEMLKPTHKWATEADLLKEFEKDRSQTIDYVKNAKGDMHDHYMEHPAFGYLDAYQWIIILGAHSARHTAQIEEVKATPGFPK